MTEYRQYRCPHTNQCMAVNTGDLDPRAPDNSLLLIIDMAKIACQNCLVSPCDCEIAWLAQASEADIMFEFI